MAEIATVPNMDDIVFEKRNKSYGAYELRKTYDKHVNTSIAIAIALFLLFVSLPAIVKMLSAEEKVVKAAPKKVRYTDLAPPPPLDEKTPPPPKLDIPPPKPITRFVPPEITQEEVPEEQEMPTIEEVKQTDTGPAEVEGEAVTFEAPTAAVVEPDVPVESVYTIVEQMPEFPGGAAELMKYLSKKMKYPAIAQRMGVEGTVFVNFIVSKEGKIDEVNIVKGISKECDEEASRVIKAMPDWKPGKQNGRSVAVRYTLPVRFKMTEQ
ncbi:MAG: TonB family protein [Bacteroidota bacterium]